MVVVSGDSARWLVDVSKSGSGETKTVHLLIKPVDAWPGNLRRGHDQPPGLPSAAGFGAFRAYPVCRVHLPGKTMSATSRSRRPRTPGNMLWRTASVGGRDMDLSKLNFGYALKGRRLLEPTQVYETASKP